MMQPVDVLYFVEHVARELDTACLVKHLAGRNHGLNIHVDSLQFGLDRCLEKFSPYVVAVPFMRFKDEYSYLGDLVNAWQGVPYLDLAFEQFLTPLTETGKRPRDKFTVETCHHHAWGPNYKSFIMKHGVPAEHIFTNGNPAFQLYREPYNRLFPSRNDLAVRHHLAMDRPWLFFPENYGWALDSSVAENYLRRGAPPNDVAAHAEAARRSLSAVLQWWGRVANETGAEVIVRPRPAVPTAQWRKVFRSALGAIPAHIHIIKDGSVREWVLASDAVFSSYSTTLLEAAIADRPVYMLEPVRWPECFRAPWFDMLPRITGEDEMMSICGAGGYAASHELKAYAIREGLNCSDAFDGLCRILRELRQQSAGPATRNAATRSGSGVRERLAKRILPLIGKGGPSRRLFEKDDFSQEDVEKGMSRWAKVCGTR